MGRIKKKEDVKLIIGLIFREEKVYFLTKNILEKKFGRIDFESPSLDFKHTHYYEEDLGKDLKRKFLSFESLIKPDSISKIRHFTQKVEKNFFLNRKRTINIDPGYLDLSKLVLSTTKDYRHRVYLRDGIYAEVTLSYERGSFKVFDWTYPDYRTSEYIEIFNRIRQIYREQVKNEIKSRVNIPR